MNALCTVFTKFISTITWTFPEVHEDSCRWHVWWIWHSNIFLRAGLINKWKPFAKNEGLNTLHWLGWLSSFSIRSFLFCRSVLCGLMNCQTCSFTLHIWMEWTRGWGLSPQTSTATDPAPVSSDDTARELQHPSPEGWRFQRCHLSLSICCGCFFYYMKPHFNRFTGYLLFPLLIFPLLSNLITHQKVSLSTAKPPMILAWVLKRLE